MAETDNKNQLHISGHNSRRVKAIDRKPEVKQAEEDIHKDGIDAVNEVHKNAEIKTGKDAGTGAQTEMLIEVTPNTENDSPYHSLSRLRWGSSFAHTQELAPCDRINLLQPREILQDSD
jgi:hypothetical protein